MNIRKLLLFTLTLLTCHFSSMAQPTKVQFINNCPDVNMTGVDVYIDNALLVPSLTFRSATAFLDVQSTTPITIGIAPENSASVADTFYSMQITLSVANFYAIVANGVESTSGYNPLIPFRLDVTNIARDIASGPNNTDLLFVNGSTDLQDIDFRTGITTLSDNLALGDFDTDYHTFMASNRYNIRLTNTTGSRTLYNFDMDIPSIGLQNTIGVAVLSGFADPSNNSNGDTIGLWVATSSGGGMIPIPFATEREKLARVQFIHNTADTSIGKVDIYMGGSKVVDSIDFREASTYLDAYAGVPLNINVVKQGQPLITSVYDTSVILDSGSVYSSVFHGIISSANYTPRPPLKLNFSAAAKEEAINPATTDVLFMHSATDFPFSDVDAGTNVIINNIGYDLFQTASMSLTPTNQVLLVDTNNQPYLNYQANLQAWNTQGLGITILYSGFFYPDSNSSGPMFGLWAALPAGGSLIQLPIIAVNVNNIANNTQHVNIYPNPSNEYIFIEAKEKVFNIEISNLAGQVVLKQSDLSTGSKVNIKPLVNGTYTIKVSNGDKTYYKKLIKQ